MSMTDFFSDIPHDVSKNSDFPDAKQLRDNQVNKIKANFIEMIQVASNKGHTEIVIDEAQYNSSILSSLKASLKDKGYKLAYESLTGTLTISW